MNAVDRSDEILGTQNVLRKCVRWWKTLFFHLIDIAVVNSFILFREHQAQFPDEPGLKCTADYSLTQFREEIVRQYGSCVTFMSMTVRRFMPLQNQLILHLTMGHL